MVPGVDGTERSVSERAALLPQLLEAVTEIFPEAKPAGRVRETPLLPCPLLICAPEGAVQL